MGTHGRRHEACGYMWERPGCSRRLYACGHHPAPPYHVKEEGLTQIKDFVQKHPLIAGWTGLAIGMVAILLFTAKDVGLLPTQMAVLVATTIVLAGLCVWIVSWE